MARVLLVCLFAVLAACSQLASCKSDFNVYKNGLGVELDAGKDVNLTVRDNITVIATKRSDFHLTASVDIKTINNAKEGTDYELNTDVELSNKNSYTAVVLTILANPDHDGSARSFSLSLNDTNGKLVFQLTVNIKEKLCDQVIHGIDSNLDQVKVIVEYMKQKMDDDSCAPTDQPSTDQDYMDLCNAARLIGCDEATSKDDLKAKLHNTTKELCSSVGALDTCDITEVSNSIRGFTNTLNVVCVSLELDESCLLSKWDEDTNTQVLKTLDAKNNEAEALLNDMQSLCDGDRLSVKLKKKYCVIPESDIPTDPTEKDVVTISPPTEKDVVTISPPTEKDVVTISPPTEKDVVTISPPTEKDVVTTPPTPTTKKGSVTTPSTTPPKTTTGNGGLIMGVVGIIAFLVVVVGIYIIYQNRKKLAACFDASPPKQGGGGGRRAGGRKRRYQQLPQTMEAALHTE